jgi:hypothetical protein
MIWLTWRQFRTQAAAVYGPLAVFAVLLAVTGPRLAHRYASDPGGFLSGMSGSETTLYVLGVLLVLATPFAVGMFWGAPLVTRELDAGTHRLAWTQSCTRTRWLAAKLGLMGVAAMAAAGLLSLAVTWWAAPIDQAIAARNGRPGPGFLVFPRLSAEIFDSRGIAPIGHAAFAFLLGVTAGVLVRRTLAAMAIAVAVFAVAQVVMTVGVRPHLVTPERVTTPITARNLTFVGNGGKVTVTIDRPGAWVTGQHTVDASGRPVPAPSYVTGCLGTSPASRASCARLAREGYRQVVTYQPASRFWTIQRDETVLYLVLALLLGGVCAWRVRRLS